MDCVEEEVEFEQEVDDNFFNTAETFECKFCDAFIKRFLMKFS